MFVDITIFVGSFFYDAGTWLLFYGNFFWGDLTISISNKHSAPSGTYESTAWVGSHAPNSPNFWISQTDADMTGQKTGQCMKILAKHDRLERPLHEKRNASVINERIKPETDQTISGKIPRLLGSKHILYEVHLLNLFTITDFKIRFPRPSTIGNMYVRFKN